MKSTIHALMEQYRPGYGLPAGFYTDPDVWAAGEHDDQFRWLVRGPLAPGYESETIGGKRVAPLMGRSTESDEASVFSNFNPLDSLFMSADHATMFNIRPAAHNDIYWQTTWLVDKDAPQESFIGDFQRWYVRRLRQQVGAPEPVSA